MSMAGCSDGAKAAHELTSNPDHQMVGPTCSHHAKAGIGFDPLESMIDSLLVEGEEDAAYVLALFARIGLPQDTVAVIPMGGKREIASQYSSLSVEVRLKSAALIDLDMPSIVDARREAAKQLGVPQEFVFAAVPTIEAWLFADVDNALRFASTDTARAILKRLPLPEDIPYPRYVAHNVFRRKGLYPRTNFALIFSDMNIEIAASRSPSLRQFIEAFEPAAESPRLGIDATYGRSVSRDVLSNLIDEVSPSTTIVYRTMEGDEVTAADMSRSIREGSHRGRQYASDLLRIARGLLADMAHTSSKRGLDDLEDFKFEDE